MTDVPQKDPRMEELIRATVNSEYLIFVREEEFRLGWREGFFYGMAAGGLSAGLVLLGYWLFR